MNILEYPDADMMALELANLLVGELRATLEHEERALFVVPGGTTPGPIFDVLCAARLEWDRIDVALSDERCRPLVHVRSNTRLIRERLLTDRAAAAQYLPLYAPDQTPQDAATTLGQQIEPRLPISVLLLGMGADMHTASLFPGADNLALALGRDAPALVAMQIRDEPEHRITMSARVLDAALSKHLVITGDAKRAAFERARAMTPDQAPVAAVMNGMQVHWAP